MFCANGRLGMTTATLAYAVVALAFVGCSQESTSSCESVSPNLPAANTVDRLINLDGIRRGEANMSASGDPLAYCLADFRVVGNTKIRLKPMVSKRAAPTLEVDLADNPDLALDMLFIASTLRAPQGCLITRDTPPGQGSVQSTYFGGTCADGKSMKFGTVTVGVEPGRLPTLVRIGWPE